MELWWKCVEVGGGRGCRGAGGGYPNAPPSPPHHMKWNHDTLSVLVISLLVLCVFSPLFHAVLTPMSAIARLKMNVRTEVDLSLPQVIIYRSHQTVALMALNAVSVLSNIKCYIYVTGFEKRGYFVQNTKFWHFSRALFLVYRHSSPPTKEIQY